MKKLLLVGGFGFIGKNMIELLKDKYKIVVIARNIDETFTNDNKIKFYKYEFGVDTKIDEILKDELPDFIVNLVSVVTANRDLNLFNDMIDSNVKILLELFKASIDNPNLKLFINFGSAEEYGNIPAPFKETDRECPNSPYSLAKQLMTNTAIMLNTNYNFPIMVIRPGNVFGKYQNKDKFIPYIVRKLLQNDLIETTSVQQKRDFIYINDLVHILDRMMENHPLFIGEIVNVSYGESFLLKDIIELCKRHIRSVSKVEYGKLAYRENEIMDFRCDIQKLRQKISFDFKFDVYSGLKHYIKVMREG